MPQIILADTQSLINDALFRCGEEPGASEWDGKALDYMNREYRAVCSGASEFLPEFIHDWWWMRASGVLTLDPVFSTGSVNLVQGSATVTLNSPPAYSLVNWRFRSVDFGETYVVLAHTAATPTMTLDSPYNGPTLNGAMFRAMHVLYDLNTSVAALISPVSGFRANQRLYGMAPERLDELFPIANLQPGVPQAFALENDRQIRFSHGGLTTGTSMRMEYKYRPLVDDLANNSTNYPLLPINFRHILSDMTLVYLFMDKNDDRMAAIGTSVRSALGAMVAENRRRITKIDQYAGHIFPRQGSSPRNFNNVLRTESGLIIG